MNEVVVSTRVRIARNLKNYPFPCRLSGEKAKEVADKVEAALKKSSVSFKRTDMKDLGYEERVSLAERHLISPEFCEEQEGRALLLSDDNTVSVMINEEDHIRLQVILPSQELDKAYEIADSLDNVLSKELELAFSEKLGYLTQCPTNLGTALRASVMLHLPALQRSGAINRIGNNLSKLGLTIRGLYGESSKPSGAFYQLSNQVTLGISEKDAIENLKNITRELMNQELKTRDRILSDIRELDTVSRSLGILKSAMVIDHSEAMKLLSNVRLGAAAKKLSTLSIENLDRLITDIQPATLSVNADRRLSAEERDIKRAELLREKLN